MTPIRSTLLTRFKQILSRLSKFWDDLSSEQMARIFVFTLITTGFLLYVLSQWLQCRTPDLFEILDNISMEFIGAAITFWILDQMIEKRRKDEDKRVLINKEKEGLIRLLRSDRNVEATQAAMELQERGWLADGTLKGVVLMFANLEGAYLMNADFQGVDLRGANLQLANLRGADLRSANLRGAKLKGADLEHARFDKSTVLPDGSAYKDDVGVARFTELG